MMEAALEKADGGADSRLKHRSCFSSAFLRRGLEPSWLLLACDCRSGFSGNESFNPDRFEYVLEHKQDLQDLSEYSAGAEQGQPQGSQPGRMLLPSFRPFMCRSLWAGTDLDRAFNTR